MLDKLYPTVLELDGIVQDRCSLRKSCRHCGSALRKKIFETDLKNELFFRNKPTMRRRSWLPKVNRISDGLSLGKSIEGIRRNPKGGRQNLSAFVLSQISGSRGGC